MIIIIWWCVPVCRYTAGNRTKYANVYCGYTPPTDSVLLVVFNIHTSI